MINRINSTVIFLILIVILGSIVRVYNLSQVPFGFFADEASIGYNAYSLLKTGGDEYGVMHPIFFRAFGEFKNPIQIYSTIPFIALFGLNESSIRGVSSLYGILGILGIFLLTKELFRNRKEHAPVALLSSLFLAISPWHVHLSRVSLEGLTSFVFFTIFSIFLFLKSQTYTKILPVSAVFFALSLYTYFPARIFLPLLGGIICISYLDFFLKNKKETIVSLTLFLMLSLPLLMGFFNQEATARWKQVSIFSNPPNNTSVPNHILNNYLSHFSLDFLFLKGDIDMPGQFITRHSVRGVGELYLFQLPLVFFGIFFLWKKKCRRIFFIICVWFLLYPLGSMFTTSQEAQATRSIIGVVPFQILSATGLFYLHSIFQKRKFFLFVFIVFWGEIITLSFLYFLYLYFGQYPLYSSDFWGWQYGARGIVTYFTTREKDYTQLIIAPEFNSPDIFFKFYAPNDCRKCMIGLPHENYNPNQKQLFAVTPSYIMGHGLATRFRPMKTIYYLNKAIAFEVGEIVE